MGMSSKVGFGQLRPSTNVEYPKLCSFISTRDNDTFQSLSEDEMD